MYCAAEPGQVNSRWHDNKKKTKEQMRKKYDNIRSDEQRCAAYKRRYRRHDRQKNAHKRKIGQERYNLIENAVPRRYLRDTRMEIVAEACLLYAEGHMVDEAVKLATRKVNRDNEMQDYKSRNIDDCFWL